MVDRYVWIASYSLAVLVTVIGSFYLLVTKKRQRKKAAIAVGIFFVSIVFLEFPVSYVERDHSLFEAVFGSILESIEIVKGRGYVPIVINSVPGFSLVYSSTLLVLQLLVFGATAGVVLSLFKLPIQVFRAYWSRGKEIYVFSGFNKKTYSIAESVSKKKGIKLIFADCLDIKEGDIEKINRINGIYLKGDFASISTKMAKKCRKIYLFIFDELETDNIFKLSALCKSLSEINYDAHIRVYVELIDTAWDEQNYINTQNKLNDNIIINYVRIADNFAINNLYKNSIFENAINEHGAYNIKVLVIGGDEYSYAMIRHILALGQMPGFFVHVYVIDKNSGRDIFKKQFPELCEYMNEEGNARYTFSYYENVNPNTYSFEQLIENVCSDFTFCFVSMGDDVQNHVVASCLNRIRYRCGNKSRCIIQVKDIHKGICDKYSSCYEHMQVVGDYSELYSCESITGSTIEEVTKKIHEVRQKSKDKQNQKSWECYAKDEYKRRSSYNRTLSIRYKIGIIDKFYDSDYSLLAKDVKWAMYEHMRWNMYIRSLGYVKGKETQNERRVHKCLTSFDRLTEKEKQYDYITVDKEIVDLLSQR